MFDSYFWHEEGANHFSIIHKVFGSSNFSKLLTQLLESDRFKAVAAISYEVQARLQNPTHGCLSHIRVL